VSKATLDMFCAMLGTVAGDLVLLFRARGGIALAGGIVPRIAQYLAQSEFRARFEGKGRVRAYLEAIPTSVIVHPDPAFRRTDLDHRERARHPLRAPVGNSHCGSIFAALYQRAPQFEVALEPLVGGLGIIAHRNRCDPFQENLGLIHAIDLVEPATQLGNDCGWRPGRQVSRPPGGNS
jgi:Glucokinase